MKCSVKTPTPSPISSEDNSDDDEGCGYLHPLLRGDAMTKINEPAPGFIGPATKPRPQKISSPKVSNSDIDNLEELIQQHHRLGNVIFIEF